jgi:hypothetical protein
MDELSAIAFIVAQVTAILGVIYMVARFVLFSWLESVSTELDKFRKFKYFIPEEIRIQEGKQLRTARTIINIILYSFYILITLSIILAIVNGIYHEINVLN